MRRACGPSRILAVARTIKYIRLPYPYDIGTSGPSRILAVARAIKHIRLLQGVINTLTLPSPKEEGDHYYKRG